MWTLHFEFLLPENLVAAEQKTAVTPIVLIGPDVLIPHLGEQLEIVEFLVPSGAGIVVLNVDGVGTL